MTVETTNNFSGPYAPNGIAVDFPFTFTVDPGTSVYVELDRELVPDADYSISYNANNQGGTVNFVDPPVGSEMYIYFEPSFTQDTSFENSGPFLASSVEDVNDRHANRAIYLKGQVDRTIRYPVGVEGFVADMGVESVFGVDADGDPAQIPMSSFAAGPQGEAGDVAKVLNVAELSAIAATSGMTRYMVDETRKGIFSFVNSNLSAEVTADPTQMNYVAPDSAPTGTSGAWVRKQDAALIGSGGAALIGFAQADAQATPRTMQDKGSEILSAADFAGATDTIKISNALAAALLRGVQTKIYLDRAYTVTSLTNPYGIEFVGPGRIQQAITGGNEQLNSYADAPGRIVYGREYLHRVIYRAAQGQAGAPGQLGIGLYGDSTVATPSGYMTINLEDHLAALMQTKGVGNVAITNNGVAGTTVADLDLISDLDPTLDLAIIKYGINDGGNPDATRLATFATTLDAKLTAVRAAANGSVGGLSIILVGPNTTADTPNGRDERWYEQLRGVFVAAARKHQCCYVDAYAAFQDGRGGATLWLDDPYGDGRGVHPRDSLGFKIWSLVADTIIGDGEAVTFGTSNFRNLASGVYAPTNAALPSQWPMGLTVARAQSGSGFPLDGFVVSMRSPEQGVIQWLYPYAANNSRALVRTANVGADTFNRWTGVAEALTLQNGWANFGGGFASAAAIMGASGMVMLQGMIAGGTTTANTLLATLPAGMAPASSMMFECAGNATRVMIKVQSNGEIRNQSVMDATFTSLDGISFLAA